MPNFASIGDGSGSAFLEGMRQILPSIPFLSGLFVFRSVEDRFLLLNCLLGKASSFSAALLPGGHGGVQHNDKCQENFKVFPLLPSPLFPEAANKLFRVARTRRCLRFPLPSPSPPPRDNDEKRRLFPPLSSDLLLKSARRCLLLHTLRAAVITAHRAASRSPLVDCSFPQGREGGSERSARDLGTYPPLFTAARGRTTSGSVVVLVSNCLGKAYFFP